ncbi:MAG: hypothetical protein R2939_20990 [Kofleriaceae bacterium]
MSPSLTPPDRYLHAMATDVDGGRIVMFGGFPSRDDTYAWTGATWQVVSSTVRPPARYRHSLAAAPGTGTVLLYGGFGTSPLDDTWELVGDQWVQRTPEHRPGGSPVTVGTSTGTLLYGGGFGHDETWRWNGADGCAAAARPCCPAPATPSPSTPRGGGDPGGGQLDQRGVETWAQADDTWVALQPPSRPSATIGHVAAYDRSQGQTVVLTSTSGALQEHWQWDGTAWTRHTPELAPTTTFSGGGVALAFHDATATLIAAVATPTEPTLATWRWDGATWTQLAPASAPPRRVDFALAPHAARDELILFGGLALTTGNPPLADTWRWDGTSWTQATPATSPPARFEHGLADDVARGRLVLFGGRSSFTQLRGDTWEWDGDDWVVRTTAIAPAPRFAMGFAYDPAQQRAILVGGETVSATIADAWAWDGVSWREASAAPARGPLARAPLSYDAARRELVSFGGLVSSGTFATSSDELWTLTSRGAATEEACSSGLDGDGDGTIGCADVDCASVCDPTCDPAREAAGLCVPSDPLAPRCGDGACAPVEDCGLCPADCGVCPPACGDARCELTETTATCPGDCPP